MSMHLLPAFVTTNNTKKRKRKRTQKQIESDAAHAKFLKKMGYKGTVVQRSERAAHNRVVAGSNPAGPTIPPFFAATSIALHGRPPWQEGNGNGFASGEFRP